MTVSLQHLCLQSLHWCKGGYSFLHSFLPLRNSLPVVRQSDSLIWHFSRDPWKCSISRAAAHCDFCFCTPSILLLIYYIIFAHHLYSYLLTYLLYTMATSNILVAPGWLNSTEEQTLLNNVSYFHTKIKYIHTPYYVLHKRVTKMAAKSQCSLDTPVILSIFPST